MKLTKEQEIINKIVSEARNNPDFKMELMDDPMIAIRKFTGRKIILPKGVKQLVVVDQSDPYSSFLNIPKELDLDDIELTDEQLEEVAGGNGPTPPIFEIGSNDD